MGLINAILVGWGYLSVAGIFASVIVTAAVMFFGRYGR